MSTTTEAIQHGLKNRHIQMIALGGSIGTGLFYGSSESIGLAGPAVLLAYMIAGAVIFIVVRALGEMSVYNPNVGTFSRYAYDYWSPRAGFIAGWNYWFNYLAVAMAELTVVGTYVHYWFPGIPGWVSAATVLAVVTAVNLAGVATFGEFEFWFAIIKIVAVIGMIVLGLVVVFAGLNSNPELPDPSFAHIIDHGGIFPNGITGMLSAFVVVMFSFGGVELVGITAGEAEDPRRTIPKAINQVIYRILIFYVGALFVIMSVIPWNRIDGQASPFVQIFDSVGITIAAHILNFVVLTAALSVYNSGLYSNGRMLYTLAEQGNAPKFLAKLNKRGVPAVGVLLSSFLAIIAVLVIAVLPEEAFGIIMSTAMGSALVCWVIVLLTQRKFRQHIGAEEASKLEFTIPGGAVSWYLALAALLGMMVLMVLSPNYRIAVVVTAVWVCGLLLAYEVKQRVNSSR